MISIYELAQVDGEGVYRLTDLGRALIDNEPAAVRHIDEGEGMIKILSLISTKPKARASELSDEWTEYVRANSRFQADSSIWDSLRRRIGDLKDRGLIKRVGHAYAITEKGRAYLGAVTAPDPKQATLGAITAFNDSQRRALHDLLSVMNPYRFEELVGELLSAMGYEDVQVTKQSGDKGIDVVATVDFGITTVTEVIQVKRHKGNIARHVLDQLRGSLHYFNALRGTIITTGGFSKGCTDVAVIKGEAPIGLIDGDRLIDLLFEHRIGVIEHSATLLEADKAFFDASPAEETGEPTG